MCLALNVKEKSYYSWLKRGVSSRDVKNKMILRRIEEIRKDDKKICYGSPKMVLELEASGLKFNHKRISRIMKENSIYAQLRRKHNYKNHGKAKIDIAPNLLDRKFNPSAKNKVWTSDITYIPTHSGWTYLCAVMDLFGKKIIGWSISNSPDTNLVLSAIKKAIERRNPDPGLLIHSDQGCQYTSNMYIEFLKQNKFVQSMSRRGNCWDNACIESFFGHLKNEWLWDFKFSNLEEVKNALFDYIDGFYNTRRFHSSNKGMTPVEYEKKYA